MIPWLSLQTSTITIQQLAKAVPSQDLFLWYFTTAAAMFQLCPCYQKWERCGGKSLQTLTFPLLHHAGLLWETPHRRSLTVLATLQRAAPYRNPVDFIISSCQYSQLRKTLCQRLPGWHDLQPHHCILLHFLCSLPEHPLASARDTLMGWMVWPSPLTTA